MSSPLRFNSLYNVIVAEGPKTFIHRISVLPFDDKDDKITVYYDRIVILPCGESSPTDACLGTGRHSITTYHVSDSVDKDKYEDIMNPGFYRLILDFNDEQTRDKYKQFDLDTTIPLTETGTTKDTDKDLEASDVLDAVKLGSIPDDKNNTEVYPVVEEYVPSTQDTKT